MKLNRKLLICATVAVLAIGSSRSASASQVLSLGYNTPNGNGNASGGSFNYWDLNYSGAGSTNIDGAPLTGGSGDLTDGTIASGIWNKVENLAGTGPYVGWRDAGGGTSNPLLTFSFAGSPTINSISVHLDNSGIGGVFGPGSIFVDGVAQAFTGPALGTIGWANITGLNLTGNSHTIQFNQLPGQWAFVSEITFAQGAVPEPASWALMILGFGVVGAGLRRRTANVSYA
jgi:PEP-CTERM motif